MVRWKILAGITTEVPLPCLLALQGTSPAGHYHVNGINTPADIAIRWPLALRFIKGAIHGAILIPVMFHGLFAALIVFLDQHHAGNLGLPASIVSRIPT